MRKSSILLGLIALAMFQACAPAAETGAGSEPEKKKVSEGERTITARTVSFAGLIALVVDPCTDGAPDCDLTTDPNLVNEVRAIPVDSRYASPNHRNARSSHHPYIVGVGLVDTHNATDPDEYFNGEPAWSLRGRTVRFKNDRVDLSGPVNFDQDHIIQMSWTHLDNQNAGVWDWAARTVTGSVVQLKGGRLAADRGTDHRWWTKLAKADDSPCRGGQEVTDQVQFTAEFDEIVVTEGNGASVVLRFSLPDSTRGIDIMNHPGGGSDESLLEHFKEFYDVSDQGQDVRWVNRCNKKDECKVDQNGDCVSLANTGPPVHMVSTKTAFCPPVIFTKN